MERFQLQRIILLQCKISLNNTKNGKLSLVLQKATGRLV